MLLGFALRAKAKWPAIFIFAVMVFVAETQLMNIMGTWTEASAAAVQSVVIGGPLFGALAAWQSGSIARGSYREQLDLSKDFGVKASLGVYLGNTIWALTSYLALVVIVHLQVAPQASWGQPTWVWLLGGAISLALHVAGGHLLGFLIPGFLTPMLAALALFSVDAFLMLSGGGPRSILSPGYSQVQVVAFPINQGILVFQALWFLGLTVASLSMVSLFLKGPKAMRWVSLSLAVLGAGVSGFLVSASPTGFYILSVDHWSPVCAGSPSVCIHPAHESKRDLITKALEPTLEHLEGTTFVGTQYEWRNRGFLGAPSVGAIAFHLDGIDGPWAPAMRQELVRDLFSPGSQSGGPCENGGPGSIAYASLGNLLAGWLTDDPNTLERVAAEDRASAKLFLSWNEEKKKSWLSANTQLICSGSLTSKSFK